MTDRFINQVVGAVKKAADDVLVIQSRQGIPQDEDVIIVTQQGVRGSQHPFDEDVSRQERQGDIVDVLGEVSLASDSSNGLVYSTSEDENDRDTAAGTIIDKQTFRLVQDFTLSYVHIHGAELDELSIGLEPDEEGWLEQILDSGYRFRVQRKDNNAYIDISISDSTVVTDDEDSTHEYFQWTGIADVDNASAVFDGFPDSMPPLIISLVHTGPRVEFDYTSRIEMEMSFNIQSFGKDVYYNMPVIRKRLIGGSLPPLAVEDVQDRTQYVGAKYDHSAAFIAKWMVAITEDITDTSSIIKAGDITDTSSIIKAGDIMRQQVL